MDACRRLATPRVVDAVHHQLLAHVLQQLVRVQQHRQTEVAATRPSTQPPLLLEEGEEHAASLEDRRALAPLAQLLLRLAVVDATQFAELRVQKRGKHVEGQQLLVEHSLHVLLERGIAQVLFPEKRLRISLIDVMGTEAVADVLCQRVVHVEIDNAVV